MLEITEPLAVSRCNFTSSNLKLITYSRDSNWYVILLENVCDISHGWGTYTTETTSKQASPSFKNVDSAIHQISLYPLDPAISLPNTYPLDSNLSE